MQHSPHIDTQSISQLMAARHLIKMAIEAYLSIAAHEHKDQQDTLTSQAREFEKLEPMLFNALRTQNFASSQRRLAQLEQNWHQQPAMQKGLHFLNNTLTKMA